MCLLKVGQLAFAGNGKALCGKEALVTEAELREKCVEVNTGILERLKEDEHSSKLLQARHVLDANAICVLLACACVMSGL